MGMRILHVKNEEIVSLGGIVISIIALFLVSCISYDIFL
jgi:hypothetical protein